MKSEETIFTQALLKSSAEERAAFVAQACADDAELRKEVEALLDAHDRKDGLLESPPAGIGATAGALDPAPDACQQVGATVGNYKLLQQIGEGGMGVVFMAEQVHPVRRRVALKIIKPGMDTGQVIARFEAERQALAMMDHPNIAKVLEAGSTDAGRPYFVMELVRGIPITEYCDQHQLTPRQRLELFVEVCQAVQHAHQKGIIHRDLKPNNVLVTMADDGKPVPKVIDFGIAKATVGQPLTDHTLFTEIRQLVGTPLYMSPEQAEMSAVQDVDTRSDVYSLGVLLYELLTGTTPFDKKRLGKAAQDEVRRIIREEEPPRPSTRISTLGETLTAVSAHRKTDPRKLSTIVRGELDWIVMRALEKDRGRRYATALGFAQDVERYLADQPVEACPPSLSYNVRKFVLRHKAVVTMVAVVLLVLMLATLVSAWQAVRATRATAVALAEKKRAGRAATTATNIAEYLQQMLATATPGPNRGPNYTVRQMLDDFTEGLEGKLPDQPEAEASLQGTIGNAYCALGVGDKSEKHLARALDLLHRVYGDQHERYADTLVAYALALRQQSTEGKDRLPEAEADVRRALTIYQNRGVKARAVLYTLNTLELILSEENKADEVDTVSFQLIALARGSPEAQWSLDSELADAAMRRSDYAEAEVLYRPALAAELRMPGPAHSDAAWVYVKLANALEGQHKFADALDASRKALELMQLSHPEEHWSIALVLDQISRILRSTRDFSALARTFASPKELDPIEALYRKSAATRPVVAYGQDPPTAAINGLTTLVDIYLHLSGELAAVGRAQQADTSRRKAITLFDSLQSILPDNPELLAIAYPNLILALRDLGRSDDANVMLRKLLELNPRNPVPLDHLAKAMINSPTPANRYPALAVYLAEKATVAKPNDVEFWNTLGIARYRAEDFTNAIEAFGKSRELQRGQFSGWNGFYIAMAQFHLGHQDDARRSFDQAVAWTDKYRSKNQEILRLRKEASDLIAIPRTSMGSTRPMPTTGPMYESDRQK